MLGLIVVLLAAGGARAEGPVTVRWETLPDVLAAAWATGPGHASEALAASASAAGLVVPVGPVDVVGGAQLGNVLGDQVLVWVETPLRGSLAERRAWTALATLDEAEGAEWQLRWAREVYEVFATWWLQARIRVLLDASAGQVESDVTALEQAVAAGMVPEVDLLDVRADLGRIRAEAHSAAAEAAAAEARVEALVGLDLSLLNEPGEAVADDNPWLVMLGRAAAHPMVRVAEAEAREAEARVAALFTPPLLQTGGLALTDGRGGFVPMAFLGLAVPVQPETRAERRRARGEAAAAWVRAAWAQEQVAAGLRAEAQAWAVQRARLDQLRGEFIVPLEERLSALQHAWGRGEVTADRLVRARAELRGAQLEVLAVVVLLEASEARAFAVARSLGER